jgi:hypothetical protein
MSAVGFEPTRIAPPELESGALDRSAKLTRMLVRDMQHWATAVQQVRGITRG